LKEFISYDRVRDDALKLAKKIYDDGFVPDIIYVSLRGGAYMGNVISEYFKVLRREGRPVFYAAVVARSYTDIRQDEAVRVDGWTYSPEHLRMGDKILLVDDIYDTGRTINYLVQIFLEKGIPRKDIKVAVHDYKKYLSKEEELPIVPDYYCRKIEVRNPDEDFWIHYMSHELVGLTKEEAKKYYISQDPDLEEPMRIITG
jgi:hypoxanthine phosphoribosyltransferase